MQMTTDAIVLRSFKLEDNRILTLLTRDYGVLTAYANGAERPRSALAPATELLCHTHFVLFKNRERCIVDKADTERIYFGIRSRYEDLALASYFVQLAGELSPCEEPAGEYINLLLGCLHYLESEKRPRTQLKPVFELRILTLAGYMPDIVACRECGVFEGDMSFSAAAGDLLCADCLHNSGGYSPVQQGVLAAMRHIIYSPAKRLFAFSLSPESLVSIEALSEDYLKRRMEKTFKALEFYRSIQL